MDDFYSDNKETYSQNAPSLYSLFEPWERPTLSKTGPGLSPQTLNLFDSNIDLLFQQGVFMESLR
jgi:hypothetical protein